MPPGPPTPPCPLSHVGRARSPPLVCSTHGNPSLRRPKWLGLRQGPTGAAAGQRAGTWGLFAADGPPGWEPDQTLTPARRAAWKEQDSPGNVTNRAGTGSRSQPTPVRGVWAGAREAAVTWAAMAKAGRGGAALGAEAEHEACPIPAGKRATHAESGGRGGPRAGGQDQGHSQQQCGPQADRAPRAGLTFQATPPRGSPRPGDPLHPHPTLHLKAPVSRLALWARSPGLSVRFHQGPQPGSWG